MDFALQYGFRLGTLEVYPLRGEIVGPNGTVHLQPKAMEVLVCLAERPMDVVERPELLRRVWGIAGRQNRHADDNLNRCISELRHELGDHPSDPHFIQTVPRRGYRLVVPVQLMDGVPDMAVGYDAYIDDRSPAPPMSAVGPNQGQRSSSGRSGPHSWSVERLLGEMQRRRVFRVALGYPVISWGFLEVADFLVERIMGLPDPTQQLIMQLFFAFLAMGYALALYLAWATQLTPDGVKVEPDARLPGFLRGGPRVWLAMAAGLVAAVGASVWFFERSHQPQLDADCEDTIGVMPFANSSPSQQDDYLGRGLAEEVLRLLTQVSDLGVASRAAAFSLDTTDLSLQDIGRHLGVCNVLGGSVRREGDRLRITAQLIDTTTGFNVWSGTFDRQIEDIFNVYDDIASSVIRVLRVPLDEETEAALSRRPTKSVEAYDRYLQGKSILARADDESRVSRADHMFERALAFDNEFTDAWAGRCDANVNLYEFTRASQWMTAAESYCAEALERDPKLTDVRVALARLLILAGRPDEATVQLNIAKSADPENADIWRSFGTVYAGQGKFPAAERAYRRAVALAPRDLRTYQELGTLYFDTGRVEESEAVFRDMIGASRGSSAAYTGLGSALLLQGRFEESAAAYRSAMTNEPNPRTYTNAGTAYFYEGKIEEAAIMMRDAVDLSPDDYRLVGNLADTLMRLPGNANEALSLYERAATLADKALAINPEEIYALSMIAHFYAELGREDAAEAAIRKAEALGSDQFYVHYFAGLAWLDMGRSDKALASLRSSAELGYPPKLLTADPHLDRLRSAPEFRAIVEGSLPGPGDLP